MIQDLNEDKIMSNCFLLSISKPYSGKAVMCSVHRGMFSTSGGVKYIGGIS